MVVNVVKLEDIANVDYGTRVVKSNVEGNEYPVYGGGGETFRINKYNRENCVVVSRFAMSPKCTRYVNEKIFLNDSGLTVSTKDNNILLQEYLDWYLLSKNDEIYSLGRGAGQRNLEIPSFKRMLISYPTDLEEQRKIISQLKLADEIRAKKKLANDKLDEFLKSTFITMFGDPVKNTKNLDIVKVIDVCDCMVPGRDKPKSFTGNIPWITIDDLKINGITYKSKNNMGLKETEISGVKRKTIPTGSVIMSCVGNLGLCSIAGQPMVINQQLHSFQCSEKINNIYLMFVLGQMTGYMTKNASSTTVLYMNKTVCNSIPILLPKIVEQNKFAQIVEHVEVQKQKNEFVIEQMNNLFNSLSQRAFKGEL